MRANKEKFLALVTETDDSFVEELENGIQHRERLKESFMIGIKVLLKLDELGWSQKELAARLQVSPQQINKIVRGKQNLTLETIIKLQTALNIPILASYTESGNQAEEKSGVGKKPNPIVPNRKNPLINPGSAAHPRI